MCYQKKSFKAYVSRIESRVYSKMYDISPSDFAHHVRHANSWNELGVRCGLEKDKFGHVRNQLKLLMLQKKVSNMRLNTEHFRGQNKITDDVFKTIVRESNNLSQVLRKCKMSNDDKKKILDRIEYLCIDTTHFKVTRRTPITYNCRNKVDEIDEEIFKTLVKNNTTWRYLSLACGYHHGNGRKHLVRRIEKLGLNTNHFEDVIPADKVFVVDSKHPHRGEIKKKLIRDFDRPYICAGCKNEHFTNCDGLLMWNNKQIHLELEHKNGKNNDNRLDNLEFLCPNCHSQTSTYKGKNNKKYLAGQAWLEDGKTSHPPGSISSLLN